MAEEKTISASLRPRELEAVYAISRAVAGAEDIDEALGDIVRLSRPVFIFDNIVVYRLRNGDVLEPAYARAIGRGRSFEAELAWGEVVASEVTKRDELVIKKETIDGDPEKRVNTRYSLGFPLRLGEEALGALVFIRFGGPTFEPDQVRLAKFITSHVSQLLEHGQLVKRIANLEAERQLDRLQEDFISTVSHELLSPLGFIKGYATTLLRDDISWEDKTSKEFLTIIDEESDRLHELIDNLLDSSRLQADTLQMKVEPTRMETFLKDIIKRATSRYETLDINLRLEVDHILSPVDPTRLAQVFDNLFTNATKYAPGSAITVTLKKDRDMVRIIVGDEGPGIAPEHLDKLFKRFYRVPTPKTSVRGTGLGLFICKKIIIAHGGDMEVESTLGEGTSFHIHLPIMPDSDD